MNLLASFPNAKFPLTNAIKERKVLRAKARFGQLSAWDCARLDAAAHVVNQTLFPEGRGEKLN